MSPSSTSATIRSPHRSQSLAVFDDIRLPEDVVPERCSALPSGDVLCQIEIPVMSCPTTLREKPLAPVPGIWVHTRNSNVRRERQGGGQE